MLVLTIAMALAAAQERDPSLVSGVWTASETVSPLDRKRTVSQTLLSSNEVLDVRAQPSVAVFMLKCQDDDITALISWGGAFFGTSFVDVEWRVDESKIQRETWSVGQGMTGAAMTRGRSTRKLLDAIQGGKEMVIRVHGYSSVQDAVFKLGDAAPAVDSVRVTCPKA